MKDIEDIKSLRLSDFNVYRALSSGYSWVNPEMIERIRILNKRSTIDNILVNPAVLNYIGTEMINMPYTQNEDMSWSFKPPVFVNTNEEDIKRMNTIGMVYKNLIHTIQNSNKIFFTNNTSFILYNDRIEISDERDLNDVNIVNILINVISIFIVQIYKKGIRND